jgi:AbrB family looped-hinge helix DNA binding protein
MPAATLTARGQIVIPAKIRARHGLTPGTQVEFVDDPDGIRLVVRRRITPVDPAAGYGMIKVPPQAGGLRTRRLSAFDAASTLRQRKPARR